MWLQELEHFWASYYKSSPATQIDARQSLGVDFMFDLWFSESLFAIG